MSDFDFGGAFANTQQTLQQTQQSAETHGLAVQREKQTLPLDIAHLKATTRASNAYADIADQKVQADKRMQEIMGSMTLDPQASQSATLMQLGGAAIKAGDIVTGRELLMRATQAQAQEARVLADQARQKTAETKLHLEQAKRYSQLMGGVKTKEEFEQANRVFEQEFGEAPPSPEFSPETLRVLQQSAVTAHDRLYAEHSRAMEGLARAREADTASFHRESLKLRSAELERRKSHDLVQQKNGGKDVGAPSKTEVDAAKDVIEREGKAKGLDGASSRSAAFDLASRARVLRKQNAGLSAGEAHQRAFVEQVEDGFYATQKGGTFSADKNTYRTGGSVETALPAPSDRSKLKGQTYYQTPKGTLLYLGGGKWQVPDSPGAGAGGGDEEDEPDEEE